MPSNAIAFVSALITAALVVPSLPAAGRVASVWEESSPASAASAEQEICRPVESAVYFEPNVGQAAAGTAFVSRAGGIQTHIRPGEIAFVLPVSKPTEQSDAFKAPEREEPEVTLRTVRMRLVGASPTAEIQATGELVGKSNYFIGQDPAAWRTDVPHYGEVSYLGLLPGIDLVLHGSGGQLEYDFVVAPGADHSQISIAFEGADEVRIGPDGSLEITTNGGVLKHESPLIFQQSGKSRQTVRGSFVRLSTKAVGFDIGEYDPELPLIIDPLLTYSSYFGGTDSEELKRVTIDGDANIYVAGYTSSSDFPLVNEYDGTLAGYDAFVSKFDATASTLLYSTFVGGPSVLGTDEPFGLSIDPSGVAHVAGYTSSSSFPLVNAFQNVLRGTEDSYVFRLGPTGNTLVFSTYLGGGGRELTGGGLASGADGATYVAGGTQSSDFPVFNPFRATNLGDDDVFLTKFDSNGALAYSTYFGGGAGGMSDRDEVVNDIAVDAGGNVYIAGWTTNGSTFPTTPGAFQTVGSALQSGFLSKFGSTGSTLVFSTFLRGTTGNTSIEGLAIDAAGNCYVAGATSDPTFPTLNPVQPLRGAQDAFVTKFNSSGSALVYSTFLGGSASEGQTTLRSRIAISVDVSGAACVIGDTKSLDFPVVSGFQSACASCAAGREDVFVARLVPSGSSLSYSSFLGGSGNDNAFDNSLTADGRQIVVGTTNSTDFPTLSPFQALRKGGNDGFITIVGPSTLEPDLALSKSHIGNFVAGANGVYTISAPNIGSGATTDPVVVTDVLPNGMSFVSGSGTGWSFGAVGQTVTATRTDSIASGASSSFTLTVAVALGAPVSVTNSASVSTTGDINTSNNAASDVTAISHAPQPDLALTKSHSGNLIVGTNGTYSISIENVGTGSTTTDITVTDTLPAGLTLVSGSGAGWSFGAVGQTVTATRQTPIAASASSGFTLTVAVGSSAFPGVTNTATVSIPDDFNPTNNSDSDPTTVMRGVSDLVVSATESADPVVTGTMLAYSIRVRNNGPDPALDVSATDPLDAGTTFVSAVSSQGTFLAPPPGQTGIVTASFGTIGVGQEALLTLNVTVTANGGSVLTNSIDATTSSMDPNMANNLAIVATGVVGTAFGGSDTIGINVASTGAWFLRNANGPGSADLVFGYGPAGAGWTALEGDWDGDGDDSAGLYDPASGAFFLKNTNGPGGADLVFTFGAGGLGLKPVIGDWNGDGVDTIGLYAPSTGAFFLKNTNASGNADLVFTFGPGGAGFLPLTGDWDGDGDDTIGIYSPTSATFFLKNQNSSGAADSAFSYGPSGVFPVTGDWDNNGTDTVGVYVAGTAAWFLRNSNTPGPADLVFTYGPPNALPLSGDWDGQ